MMFYYSFEANKCVGIVSVDESKVKNDALGNLVKNSNFFPLEDAHALNQIEGKSMAKQIVITASKNRVKADGDDYSLIKITGIDYGETDLEVQINGEKFQITKTGNGEMAFKLRSNMPKTYHIFVLNDKYVSNIV